MDEVVSNKFVKQEDAQSSNSHSSLINSINTSSDSLNNLVTPSPKDESDDSLSKFSSKKFPKDESDDSLSKFNPKIEEKKDQLVFTIFDNEKDEINIPIDVKNKTFCDLNQIPLSEITQPEVEFLRKIMKKASDARNEKIKQAKSCKWYNNILGTCSRVLSTLAGFAGIGSLLSLSPSSPGFPIVLVVSLISLGSALTNTVQDSFKLETKAFAKKNSADSYNSIITKTAQFLSTPGTDRKDIEIFTNGITLEMNVISNEEDL